LWLYFGKLEDMKKLKGLLLLIVFGMTTWMVVASGGVYRFSRQGTIDPQALDGEYDFSQRFAFFNRQQVVVPPALEEEELQKEVLGVSDGLKRIEVDLTNQRLYAFEGGNRVFDFAISSGKWGRTPTGVFRIWIKLRYTKMEGGSHALGTYYYLPNVPYVMYFFNEAVPQWRGYGLHGTYWHSNFGHPMSHGCINMKTEEAGLLYYWAMPDLRGKSSIYATGDNPGTTIIIYGDAPSG
jgi:lipoprotein-anchoring transpeptidase ErfK/SrfK